MKIRWILDIFRRQGLAVHMHSIRLAIAHLQSWWTSSTYCRAVTQNTIVMIPLVDRFVSLTTHVYTAVVTAPLDILRRHSTILSADWRSRTLGLVGYELSAESQSIPVIVYSLFRQVPFRSVI